MKNRYSYFTQKFQFVVAILFILTLSCTNKQVPLKSAGIKCDEITKSKITDTLNKVYWNNLRETKWKYKRIIQTGTNSKYSIETISSNGTGVMILVDSLCEIKSVDIIAGSFD